MSKELIDRLISYIPNGDGHNSQYANDLADAVVLLESNAAPVGEREAFEVYCQSIGYTLKTGDSGRYLGGYGAALWAGFKAGAAYQRQQVKE